jgi:hypothetical protein
MRRVVAVAITAAAVTLLAACQRPVPKITIQSGSVSNTVAPSTYVFDSSHERKSALDLPAITARPGATVLVDVPREVVGKGWSVAALSLDGTKALGNSGAITDSHSYRVAAESNNGNPFVVQVVQLNHGHPDGSVWSFVVKVSQS